MPSATVFSWTEPSSGSHPRLAFTSAELSTLQSRKSGSHSAAWSAIASWCAGKRSQPYTYYTPSDPIYLGASAFLYAVDSSYTADADHAIDVALDIAALSIPSDYAPKRRYMTMMAMVYDWAYARLTSTERSTLRNRIWDYIQTLPLNSSGVEYLWGTSHGNICHCVPALVTILNDGDTTQNETWRTKLNYYLDEWDDNTNFCFLAGFKAYGNSDGGSHKGASSGGYVIDTMAWYIWVVPTLERALSINPSWWTSQTWWTKLAWWMLWHWRGDHRFHKLETEPNEIFQYSISTQAYMAMIADREDNVLGESAQWLYNEIDAVENYCIWGPYNLFNMLWYNPSRPAVRPTLTRVGSGLKYFSTAGHVCVRDGWDPASHGSLVTKVPKYYTGGHQMRREGSFALEYRGSVLIRDSGVYNPSITTTYKDYDDSSQTGHRYTYQSRILAASVGRIYDSNEVSENTEDSFQRTLSSGTKFGVEQSDHSVVVSNDGGQLWDKSTVYQPGSYGDILADATWRFNGTLIAPTEDTKCIYVCTDLTDCYYSAKCTKYHRHWLWIKPGSIPGWGYPVVLVFDDLTVHSDAVGNKVYVYQLQVPSTPSGSAGDLAWTIDNVKWWHKILKPSSVAFSTVSGYRDLDNEEYLPNKSLSKNDTDSTGTNAKRVEIWPSSALTSIEFLAVIFMAPSTESAPPTTVVIDDASWLGATIGGIDCKVHKGSPYSASVGESGDTTPPDPPGQPACTAGSGFVDVDWADNTEPDLQDYDVYRSELL